MVIGEVCAEPACTTVDGIRYCNTDFWIGADNLVGSNSYSSLPTGEVTITERNICSASYHGGSLYRIEQYLQWYTGAISLNGEIWGQHPASPPSPRETTGQAINSYAPFPDYGRTVTFKNIFTPAMYVYYMTCTYSNCTEEGPNVDHCQWNSPGYLIGINVGSTPVDLSLGSISIPSAKINVNDGLPIIPVGVQTQINVPVSISFEGVLSSTILNSSVPVTLQVGIYSSTQNISIASLVANQNQMSVPFQITFLSTDIGLKTMTASVNAGGSISEANFSNNQAQLNVHIQNQYRLVREVQEEDQNGIVDLAPSKEDGCSSNKGSPAYIKIRCLKAVPGSVVDEAAEGCKIKTDLLLGNFLGGHITSATSHDQTTRPKGRFDPDTNADFVEIPKTGLDLKYVASQISGSYIAKFEGKDPNGAMINLHGVVFRVATQTPFVPFTTIPGLNFHEMNSHPGDGFYGTDKMYNRVNSAIKKYFFKANTVPAIRGNVFGDPDLSPYDNPNISIIHSQAVSLRFGGLFDVGTKWTSSGDGHCGHRKGNEIDISLSTFNNQFRTKLKRILATSIRTQKLVMNVDGERPEDISSNHWHARLKD